MTRQNARLVHDLDGLTKVEIRIADAGAGNTTTNFVIRGRTMAIKLLDVVALTEDLPDKKLFRG